MRILLTGRNGQVGHELLNSLSAVGDVIAVGREQMDLTSPDEIRRVIREIKPDLLVNPAAYTAVDKAESDADIATAVNAVAPGIMAEEMKKLGGAIVHYSTDYVFDGEASEPYQEEDTTNPQGVYGVTKLAGERSVQESGVPHLILRTSWVYGTRGHNFYLTMRRLFGERPEINVVDDQIGSPTCSETIASVTVEILKQLCQAGQLDLDVFNKKSGVYHLTSSGETSWYGFARTILTQMNLAQEPDLKPITTDKYPTPAKRPAYSVLNCAKLQNVFGVNMNRWDVLFSDIHCGTKV